MGNFYTNFTFKGVSQVEVAKALAGRTAFVTTEQDGCVMAFDEEADDQNEEVISHVAKETSSALKCPVLAILNHDDDILWYQLYVNGKLVDQYDSAPGYFDGDFDSSPEGSDAQILCGAFGSKNVAEVEKILRKSAEEEDGYVFAVERHAELVTALGIPAWVVGAGYDSLEGGELPEGLKKNDVMKVG